MSLKATDSGSWRMQTSSAAIRVPRKRIVHSVRSFNRRVSAVVPEAHGCMVFGTVDLRQAIGDRDDQCGLGCILPLAARRLAKMGRAASEQSIA
jgi:hypothetical protein